jgi:hypothetical protein
MKHLSLEYFQQRHELYMSNQTIVWLVTCKLPRRSDHIQSIMLPNMKHIKKCIVVVSNLQKCSTTSDYKVIDFNFPVMNQI